MKALEAIDKIESGKKFNVIETRSDLQKMAERGEISPSEYEKALDITWLEMSGSQKRSEYQKLK